MKLNRAEISREAIAGVTTFVTLSYIIAVNPAILATEGTGMPFSGVMTATVVLSFLMTLMMGLYAKLPFAVAPGMGLNAFFAYNLVLGKQLHWPVALGMVFWAGVIFLALSLTPARVAIAQAMPANIRSAAGVGIGIFLTFIGLKNAGVVQGDAVTLVKIGHLDRQTLLAAAGLVVTVALMNRKKPYAFLAGILGVTAVSIAAGMTQTPESWLSAPDFESVFFKLDILGALKISLLPAIFSIMLTDLFDSISTFVGVSQATGILDENGNPKNLKQGLIVDSFATFGAGLVGTSSGTAYIESSAGIEAGGRTGLTSVFTALCFIPCLFLAPVAGMIPAYATAPVLVLVGALMFREVTRIELKKLEDVIPAFLTIVLIPLTFSITQGLLWGFSSHVFLYWIAGRRKEITPVMILLAFMSVGMMALDY